MALAVPPAKDTKPNSFLYLCAVQVFNVSNKNFRFKIGDEPLNQYNCASVSSCTISSHHITCTTEKQFVMPAHNVYSLAQHGLTSDKRCGVRTIVRIDATLHSAGVDKKSYAPDYPYPQCPSSGDATASLREKTPGRFRS